MGDFQKGFINLILVLIVAIFAAATVYKVVQRNKGSSADQSSEIVQTIQSSPTSNQPINSQNLTVSTSTKKADTPVISPAVVSNKNTSPVNQSSSQSNNPVQFSKLLVGDSSNLKIGALSKKGYSIYVDSPTPIGLLSAWKGEGMSVSISDPNGVTKNLTAGNAMNASSKIPGGTSDLMYMINNGGYLLTYSFGSALAGDWKVIVSNSSNQDIDFSISTIGGSNIQIIPNTTDEYTRFPILMDALLSVTVVDSRTHMPIPDLQIKAEVKDDDTGQLIQTVDMSDDNINGYGRPHDGEYYAWPIKGLKAGNYRVSFTVSGTSPSGQHVAYKSNLTGENVYFTISSGDIKLLYLDDNGLDIVGDGKTHVIDTGFWVDVKKTGNYSVSATLLSPNGKEVSHSSHVYLSVGQQRINILFNFDEDKEMISNGAYKVKGILLFETDKTTHWVDSYYGGENGNGVYVTKSYTTQ